MDMVKEKLIDWKTAIRRNPADQLDQLLAPIFEAKAEEGRQSHRQGFARRPRRRLRQNVSQRRPRRRAAAKGEKVLLVRNETTPEDLRGMIASEGILTAKGGVSSHAALVARQMGKVCVCGAGALQIDYAAKTLTAGPDVQGRRFPLHQRHARQRLCRPAPDRRFRNRPGARREIARGHARRARPTGCLPADELVLEGHAAASPHQCRHAGADRNAVAFGATGIGLTRTEHMFFEGNRIDAMREMILADNVADRKPRSRKSCLTRRAISSASSRR
jgi:pyruvate,orthophosphate dikinase